MRDLGKWWLLNCLIQLSGVYHRPDSESFQENLSAPSQFICPLFILSESAIVFRLLRLLPVYCPPSRSPLAYPEAVHTSSRLTTQGIDVAKLPLRCCERQRICLGHPLLNAILKQQPLISYESVGSLASVGMFFCSSQGSLMWLHSAGSSAGLKHSGWFLSHIWDLSWWLEWPRLAGSYFLHLVSHRIDSLAELLSLAAGV